MKKRMLTVLTALLLALGMLAGPAAADHDHKLENPGGCVTVKVGHQDHDRYDGDDNPKQHDSGRKFHGGAHVGAATDVKDGVGTLGQGNSPVTVAGGEC